MSIGERAADLSGFTIALISFLSILPLGSILGGNLLKSIAQYYLGISASVTELSDLAGL